MRTPQLAGRVCALAIVLLVLASSSPAQWSDNPAVNTIVYADTTGTDQVLPRAASDGIGGLIVTWQESRDSVATGTDIHVKRLDQNGITKWTVAVCRAAGNQTLPEIAADGQGGAIIAWLDERAGNTDIYAQRVSSLGGILWPLNGRAICTDAANQTNLSLSSDDLGGATLAWEDSRAGAGNANIYAQKLSAGGITQWTANGVPVCTATGNQEIPQLITDGFGGAFVAWHDDRAGVNSDVYAQHLTTTGASSWTADGVAVSAAAGRQRNVLITGDDEAGAFIAWEDTRSGGTDIYAHRIDANGSLHAGWPANGLGVCTAAGEQTLPVMTGTGLTSIILAWQDTRNVEEDLYAQLVDADANPVWTANGEEVSTATDRQRFPAITGDGFGGAIVAWQDGRNGNEDIYAQRMNSSGAPVWTVGGVPVSTETHAQELPSMVSNDASGAILTWQDLRPVTHYNVYAQLVNNAGLLGLLSIGGVVFNDRDDSGVYDVADTILRGWRVVLGGAATLIDTTDAVGQYAFTNLSPGYYTVEVEDRAGWKHTYPNSTGDTAMALDSAIGQVNFGNFELATIGGRIWDDKNEDGNVDPGEPAFTAALRWRVKLSGPVVRELDTDNSGFYRFNGLLSGTYNVTVVPQNPWYKTFPALDTISVSVVHGQDTSIDWGFFRGGSISGQVFTDQIADTVLNPADKLKFLNGWTLQLYKSGVYQRSVVTSGSGNYSFTGLHLGSYTVRESLMTGWVQTSPDSFYADNILTGGTNHIERNFGNFKTGQVTGNIYFDAGADSSVTGDAPLAGWTVRAFDTLGNLRSTGITNGSGFYTVNNLFPGVYVVSESIRIGYYQTFPKYSKRPVLDTMLVQDSTWGTLGDQRAYQVTIDSSGRVRPKRIFANFRRGQIGGAVYNDLNGDGGIDPEDHSLSGWTIVLTGTESAGGAGILNSDTTGEEGEFLFENLNAGNYRVEVVRKVGWEITRPTTADYYDVNLGVGGVVTGRFFEARIAGSLHGQVFHDRGGDGEKNDDDEGLGSKRLHLVHPGTGFVIDSTTTDGYGEFLFDTLLPGVYKIVQPMDPGWRNLTPLPPMEIEDLLENDHLMIANFELGTISGSVFRDLNGDGLNNSEQPFEGMTVRLSGRNGAVDSVLDETVTDAGGIYAFPDLGQGKYVVQLVKPVGWHQTTPPGPYVDSIVTSGEDLTGFIFGGYYWNSVTGALFLDINANGARDSGETTLPGRKVYLIANGGSIVDSTNTAGNGLYQFTGLAEGSYTITPAVLADYYQTLPDSAGGRSVSLTPAPMHVTDLDFGYFPGAISGLVFDDLSGDGILDPADTALTGWTVTLTGPMSGTTQSDGDGRYRFLSLKPGAYTVSMEDRAGWVHTFPDTAGNNATTLDSLNPSRDGIDFGNFKLISVSGIMFEDVNRNGGRDLGEPPLSNRTITLDDGGSSVNVLTNVSGNYQFNNVRGGSYTLSQVQPAGYTQSSPVGSGTYTIVAQSGQSAVNRHFGNYASLGNTILVRNFQDNDAAIGTTYDVTSKNWNLRLYRDSISPGTLQSPAITTGSSIFFTNLAADTYIAVGADSAGWERLGKVVDGVTEAGTAAADTIVLGAGTSHVTDMIVFHPNAMILRAKSDVDGRYATAGDRDTLLWDFSVYKKFIAPANLVAETTAAESLHVTGLGNDTYVAVARDSAGWRHIGTVPGDSGSEGFRSVVLNNGSTSTVDFINSPVGRITVRALRDDDGDAATDGDRSAIRWRLRIYRDTANAANLRYNDSTESLSAELVADRYIVTQSSSHSGAAWTQIGEVLDSVLDDTRHAFADTIDLAGGESRTVDFLNYDSRKRRTWTAAEDGQWENQKNWSPPFVPRRIDTVVIAVTAQPAMPTMPAGESFPSVIVNEAAALGVAGGDTVRSDLLVEGTLQLSVIPNGDFVVGRHWTGTGELDPGGSRVTFPRNLVHDVSGLYFRDLHIDTNNTGQPANVVAQGDITVDGQLELVGDLQMGEHSLLILDDAAGALGGHGTIVGGTVRRAIRTDTAGLMYRLDGDSSYIVFQDTTAIPGEITETIYSYTLASTFGDSWEVAGVNPQRSTGSVSSDSIGELSRHKYLTLGRIIAGKPTPTIRRVYSLDAGEDTGYTATLSLRYEPWEVIGTPTPNDLLILRMKYATRQTMARGWNLTSVPVVAANYRKTVLFPMAVSDAFRFDADSGGYEKTDTLKNGPAYWLKFPNDTLVTTTGTMRTLDTVSLRAGWNLVGTLSLPVPSYGMYFLPSSIGHSKFFGFDNGFVMAEELEPMRGYWVNVSHDGSLVMSAPDAGMAAKAAGGTIDAGFGQSGVLEISDASGGRQRLYLAKVAPEDSARDSRLQYLMPPPPPQGVLDARFENQTMLETYTAAPDQTESFDVLISPAAWPVQVRWEMEPDPAGSAGSGGSSGPPDESGEIAISRIDAATGAALSRVVARGTGSFSIDDPSVRRLRITVTGRRTIPTRYALYQSYPNPFNPTATIRFDIPAPARVSLTVYDILGREVAVLVDGEQKAAGRFETVFDARGLASGVYFYRLAAGPFNEVRKMVLMK